MPAPIPECRQQTGSLATRHQPLAALVALLATPSSFMPMARRLAVVLLVATAAGALPVVCWRITATALPRAISTRRASRAQPVRPLVRLLSIQLHQRHHLSVIKVLPVSVVRQGLAI